MNVANLIEKLSQFPENLDVHVMADLQKDLVDIAAVHLVSKPYSDEPFVVLETHRNAMLEDRGSELQNLEDSNDTSPEGVDSLPNQSYKNFGQA